MLLVNISNPTPSEAKIGLNKPFVRSEAVMAAKVEHVHQMSVMFSQFER
jgi:hypothetical protein